MGNGIPVADQIASSQHRNITAHIGYASAMPAGGKVNLNTVPTTAIANN